MRGIGFHIKQNKTASSTNEKKLKVKFIFQLKSNFSTLTLTHTIFMPKSSSALDVYGSSTVLPKIQLFFSVILCEIRKCRRK